MSVLPASFRSFILAAGPIVVALSLVGSAHRAAAQNAEPAGSTSTSLMIRAVSHDAKIIGSNVGGARIVVQDAATGQILADGVQTGSTGNTTLIMVSPSRRDSVRYATEGAAGFVAELDIEKPTLVDIMAYGPLGTPAAAVQSSKRMLVVPGEHVLGEGIILEMNGFTVEIVEATSSMGKVNVGARVTMLCGCPTEPGGMWNSNRIDIVAQLESAGRVLHKQKMAYAGRTSTYLAAFQNVAGGVYDLRVVASDAERGNFGMATGTAVVP